MADITLGNLILQLKSDDKYEVIGYTGTPIEIIIPSAYEGKPITRIGNEAFINCESLTSVTIGNSVTRIGNYAFNRCESLTSITIPDSVTSIGNGAFSVCSKLEEIKFNATTCSDLTVDTTIFTNTGSSGTGIRVKIGANVTKIPAYLFYAYSNVSFYPRIKSVEFEDNSACKSIGKYAFHGCDSLTSIEIPDSVTSIGYRAFYDCTSLQYYIESNLKYLGNTNNPYLYLAGVTSTSITSATINENCKFIASSAFEYCYSLRSVTIGNSVTSIGNYAFAWCESLTSITIPDSVTSIGDDAFSRCASLTSITIPFVGEKLNGTSNTHFGYIFGADSSSNNKDYVPASLKTVTITGGNTISGGAFFRCESLTSITIPDSVISIGVSAFINCTSLTSIEIPDRVTSIGNYAFKGCSALTNVIIGKSVTSIGDEVFYGCESLTSITIPDSVISIGSGAFWQCDSLTNITIGNRVTSIGDSAFYGCDLLTSIEIPDNITSIGSGAFCGCSNLQELTLPFVGATLNGTSNTHFGYIFGADSHDYNKNYVPSSLTSVTITGNSISSYAFKGCTSLRNVTILDSVTSIGESAFNGCNNLTSVNYTGTIDQWAQIEFYNSESNPLYHDNNNLYINDVLVTEIVFTTTKISSYAFYNCTQLKYIYIKSNDLTIEDNAFTGSNSIEVIINFSNLELRRGSTENGLIANNANTIIYNKSGMQQRDNVILCLDNSNIENLAAISCTADVADQTLMLPELVNIIEFSFLKERGSIYIPNSMERISGKISADCKIFYHSNIDDWNNVNKTGSTLPEESKIYYYSETKPNSNGNYWHASELAGFKISSNKDELLLDSKNLKITQDGNVTATDITLLGSSTNTNNLIDSKYFKVSLNGEVRGIKCNFIDGSFESGYIGKGDQDLLLRITSAGLASLDQNGELQMGLSNTGLRLENADTSISMKSFSIKNTDEGGHIESTGTLYIAGKNPSDDSLQTYIKLFGPTNLDSNNTVIPTVRLTMKREERSNSSGERVDTYYVVSGQIILNKPLTNRDLKVTLWCRRYYGGGFLGLGNWDNSSSHEFTITAGDTKSKSYTFGSSMDRFKAAIRLTKEAVSALDVDGGAFYEYVGNTNGEQTSDWNNSGNHWLEYETVSYSNIAIKGNMISEKTGLTGYNLGAEKRPWETVYCKISRSGLTYSESGAVDASDSYKKNTITNLSNAYSIIFDALRPVSFKYNDGTSDRLHTGFIAQEVRDATLDAGLTTKDFAAYCEWEEGEGDDKTTTCGLRYSEFIPLNTYEIQKLKSRVKELEATVEELKSKIK